MNIRKAHSGDAAGISALYDGVWSREINILGPKLAQERRASQATVQQWIEEHTYFLVETDGIIVAVLGCEQMHGTLHLVHLATHPDHRRQGLAEELMLHAEQFARDIVVNKVWFDTAPGLDASNRLYEKLGYQRCGHLQRHYWGTDIVLYEKLL